jgi:PBP1b-binding outer membrane lipoprotein LpoB
MKTTMRSGLAIALIMIIILLISGCIEEEPIKEKTPKVDCR